MVCCNVWRPVSSRWARTRWLPTAVLLQSCRKALLQFPRIRFEVSHSFTIGQETVEKKEEVISDIAAKCPLRVR
jgi:hypothetical protein